MKKLLALMGLLLAPLALLRAADDIVINDFESDTFGNWKVEGTAFGPGPATGSEVKV